MSTRARISTRVYRDDHGYTLVEILISLTLATILLGVGLAVANTFFQAEKAVTTTYTNLNQLLPISTALQQDIRSAISRAPTPTNSGTPGRPTPPFGDYTASTGKQVATTHMTKDALTFFTVDKTRTSTATVIAKITASYDPTTAVFRVIMTLSTSGTCPRTSTTHTKYCTFKGVHRTIFFVDDVAMGTTPIFTYHIRTKTYPNSTPTVKGGTTTFATCTHSPATTFTENCKANAVESVGVNLIVNVDPSAGHAADEETVTYDVSSTSATFDPAVG